MKNKKYILIFVLLIIIGVLYWQRVNIKDKYLDLQKSNLPQEINYQGIVDQENEWKYTEKDIDLPDSFNIAVPFTVQAPEADWSIPYKEACEEASLLMVYYYLNNQKFSIRVAKKEIDDMVAWQIENIGEHKNLTAQEVGDLSSDYWDYDFQIIKDLNIEKMKQELVKGNPVIVPAAGRELGNPNFKQPGPLYHMLVIKGYQDDKFITHDPGTRRGENYVYDMDILMSAIRDWDGDSPDGKKVGLIIKKP